MPINADSSSFLEQAASVWGAFMQGSVDATLAISADGRVLCANPAAEALFGAPAERLRGLSLDALVKMAAYESAAVLMQSLVRAREGVIHEGEGRRLDGSQMPLAVSIAFARNLPGLEGGALVMLRSAGERHASAQALAQREARFRALSEASPVGVFAADTLGACSYTNARWQEIFSLSPDQSLGDAWLGRLHALDLPQVREEWQRCCEERAEFDMVFRVLPASGVLRQVRCRARPVLVAGEVITGFVGSVEDVTERQSLLARLHSSQLRERRLYEQTPTMLHSTDASGNLLTVSERWLMKLGWTRNDVIGRSVFDFFTPESAEALRRVAPRDSPQQGQSVRTLLQMQARLGEVMDVEVEVMLERDATDRPYRSIAVIEDVTERLRAQQALQSERQRLAYIIEATQVGTWEWNVQTGQVRFNERWAEIAGFTLAELEPLSIETWAQRAHPEDLAASNEALRRHFAREAEAYECEARMRHRDGRWIWVLDRGKVMTWTADGQAEWMFGTHQDITARKLQEATLLQSKALLDRTGRLAAVGGWELDLRTQELLWSPEVCRIHGVPEGFQPDLAGAISFYSRDAQARVVEVVQRCIDSGEPWEFELPLVRADGKRIWVRAVGQAEYADGKVVRVLGAVQDVTQQVLAREQLKTAHQRMELANSSGHIGVWDLDLSQGQLLWNDCMWGLYGLSPNQLEPTFAAWSQALHPDDRERALAEFDQALLLAQEHAHEFRVVQGSGEVRHLVSKFRISRDAEGAAIRVTGVNWDVTEARELQAKLAQQADMMRVTLSSIVDAVITTDMNGHVLWLNLAAERMLGLSLAGAIGQPLRALAEVLDEATHQAAVSPLLACLQSGQAGQTGQSVLLVRPDGVEVGIEMTASPMRNAEGVQIGVVLVLHDVSEQRRLLHEMSYRASHDDLTGLFNRGEFAMRLDRALHEAQSSDDEHAMLYIDLDQFKIINDTSGHAVGDRLLQQVSKLLARCTRQRDTLARLGGDEFGVLLEHCTAEQSQRVAQEICEQLDAFRFQHDGKRLRIGASVGLVPIDARWKSVSAIMQAADSACYAAKEAGRNRVHAWVETDHDLKSRTGDLQWAARIEQALDEDRFVLFHQRIDPISKAAVGLRAEVLVRLQEPDGNLAPPGAFLPAAERFHLASRLDRWVLRNTIAWLQSLDDLDAIESLSVNLSGQSIGDRAFHKQTITELAAVAPEILSKLCLEVTETVAVSNLGDAADFIKAVRALGLRIALDDFGAGASSFGYLKSLPVDYLKIDGQFIRNLIEDPLDAETVRCFVKVAQVVGVKTVAEFVDRAEVLAVLKDIGVDFAQGYLLHKPSALATALAVTA